MFPLAKNSCLVLPSGNQLFRIDSSASGKCEQFSRTATTMTRLDHMVQILKRSENQAAARW